jgi:hypothetical protein
VAGAEKVYAGTGTEPRPALRTMRVEHREEGQARRSR